MPFRRRLLRALVAAALVCVACQGDDGPRFPLREPLASPTGADTLVVGLVGTLSGPDSWRGEDAFEGADLGVHVLNRLRPEGSPPLELRPLDDEGDPATATALVEQLAGLGATVGVIYAGPPAGLPPAEPALARAGIPAVLCYGDLYGAGSLAPHLFQTSPSFVWEADRIASYLLGDRAYGTVGALVEDSTMGAAALAALGGAVGRRGGRLVGARHGEDEAGVRAGLRVLMRRRVEAVVTQGSPADVSAVLRALRRMGATYKTTAAARRSPRPARGSARRRPWRPQPIGFDLAISPSLEGARRGMVAADSYARGAHYLPIASMRRFREAFRAWWDSPPTGWERRAFDAARMIGWAARRAGQDDDLADVLEGLSGVRFSGLPVTFADGDHTSVDPDTIGLWVVPRPGIRVRERVRREGFASFPWVPLARGFANRRRVTHVLAADRASLFRRSTSRRRSPPAYRRLRFGVRTPRTDPVH